MYTTGDSDTRSDGIELLQSAFAIVMEEDAIFLECTSIGDFVYDIGDFVR